MVTDTGAPKNYVLRNVWKRWAGELVPSKGYVEITHRCNLRCLHCYLEPCINKPQPDELSASEWAGILKQLFEMGTWTVVFTGGEALCRPDIFEIMSHAKEQGIFFVLKTNGTLVTEPVADRLKELGIAGVDISLYAATPKTHEYVTGMAGSYDKTIRAIELLRARRIRVRIESPMMNCNIAENKALEKLARELGVFYDPDLTILPKVGQPGSTDHIRPTDEQLKTLVKERNLIITDADAKKADIEHSLVCTAGKLQYAISPQGEVFPCNLWRVPLGDLRQQSFRDIWHGEAARRVRSVGVSDRPVCASCELVGYCSHCPGLASMETGGISGPSSENCRLARILKEVKDDKKSLY